VCGCVPPYFDDNLAPEPSGGDVATLCAAFGCEQVAREVDALLHFEPLAEDADGELVLPDTYLPAEQRHQALAHALGLPNRAIHPPTEDRGMNGPHPWRVRIGQAEERPMDQQSVRKTFKYQLQPTAEQEGTLGCILRRCRDLYTAGLEERREAGRMRRVNITMAGPSAHLPASKPERPEDQDSHSQVLPEARLDRACQAFLRRG
jgi:hypothetical protein